MDISDARCSHVSIRIRCLVALLAILSCADTSAAVGRIGGEFAVNSIGAATYRIPVTVPEAANSMRPAVDLTYNSRARTGLAGVGWNLSGFSRIERCELTIALDGRRQGVTYTSQDRFCLDGQPLVQVGGGTYGGNNVEYRPEIHDYQKVTSHGTVGTGPRYFKVRLRNGLTRYYGDSETSRIEAPGTGEMRIWALTRVVDKFGNTIFYDYNERTAGEYDPASIAWGADNYRLEFEYEARPDERHGYVAGSPQARTQRLTDIRYEYQSSVVNHYSLTYEAPAASTGRTRLASVTLCATGSGCLPPTALSWQDGESGWSFDPIVIPGESGIKDTSYFDFDGDGDMDRLGVKMHRLYVSFSANGQYGPWRDTQVRLDFGGGGCCDYVVPSPIEFNGDGLTDVLSVADDGAYHVYLSTGDSTGPSDSLFVDYDTGIDRDSTAPEGAAALDMDGDGLSDLVYVRIDVPSGTGRVRYRRNLGGYFGSEEDTGLARASDGGSYIEIFNPNLPQPDFDGDGRTDLLLRGATVVGWGVYVYYDAYLSSGDGFSTELYGSTADFKFSSVQLLTPDINGDGLSDLAFEAHPGTWRTMISNGKEFGAPQDTSIDVDDGLIGDYNNDGREDLLDGRTAYLSDGNSFSATNTATIGFTVDIDLNLVDANGDGYADAVSATSAWLHEGPRADRVTEIADGLGNYHRPRYGPISTSAAYTADGATGIDPLAALDGQVISGSAPIPPVTRLMRGGPRDVVEATVENDGIGGAFTTSYRYWNAQRDMRGLGFLGFAQIETTDSRKPGGTQTLYHQDFPYLGRPKYTKTLREPAGPREEIQTWGKHTGTGQGDYHFVHRDQRIERSYENDLSTLIRQMVNIYTWNFDHGAISSHDEFMLTETWDDLSTKYFLTKRLMHTFDDGLKDNQWCLGRPTSASEIKQFREDSSSVETEARKTWLTYDPATCALTEEQTGSDSDPGQQLKTIHGIDGTGRTVSITRNDGIDSLPTRTILLGYPNNWTPRANSEAAVIDGQTDLQIQRSWDEALGLMTSLTNPQGQTTTWEYDRFGRQTSEMQTPLGTHTDFVYSSPCTGWCPNAEYVVTSLKSDGAWSEAHYDRYERKVGEVYALKEGAARRAFVYDALGRLVQENVPYIVGQGTPHWINYAYDSLDRKISECRPADENDTACQAEKTWSYWAETVYEQDAEENAVWYQMRPDGKLHTVTEVAASGQDGVSRYRHTPFGQLASIADPDDTGPTTTLTYDALGFPATEFNVDAGTRAYDYNVFGEPVSRQDGSGNNVTIEYDQLGRVTSRIENEGVTHWVYVDSGNGQGLLDTVTAPTDQSATGYAKQHTYNFLSQLTDTVSVIDGTAYRTDYAYDAQGRLASMAYPATIGYRPRFAYSYTNGYLDRIVQESGAFAGQPIYQVTGMDALGRESATVSGNGFIDSEISYDPGSTRIKSLSTSVHLNSGTISSQNYAYQWDRAGNLTQRNDLNRGLTENFVYDERNRLTETWLNGQRTQALAYHRDGRIAGKMGEGGNLGVGTYAYDNDPDSNAVTGIVGDRANVFHYDDNGNMECRGAATEACTGGDLITWYSFNKPASIHYTNGVRTNYSDFVYGPDRKRIKQTRADGSGTRRVHYVDGHFERELRGGTTGFRANVFANGRAVYAVHDSSWSTACGGTSYASDAYFVHRDHQGSVDQMTHWDAGSAGPIASSFDAFGKRRNPDWTPDDNDSQLNTQHLARRGYTGHEHLDNVRLIHMNGRLQDPIMGRMLSADPILGDLTNPQTLNRYSYVINNPASLTDPSGYWFAACENNIPTCTVVYDAEWSKPRFVFGAIEIIAETAKVGVDNQNRRYQLSEKEFQTIEFPFSLDVRGQSVDYGRSGNLALAGSRGATILANLADKTVVGEALSRSRAALEQAGDSVGTVVKGELGGYLNIGQTGRAIVRGLEDQRSFFRPCFAGCLGPIEGAQALAIAFNFGSQMLDLNQRVFFSLSGVLGNVPVFVLPRSTPISRPTLFEHGYPATEVNFR